MSDEALVLVPLPDGRALALELDEYRRAIERGHELIPATGQAQESAEATADEVLDAHGMESRTGVPASWWLEAARRGDVAHLRAGKYVRFEVGKALEGLRACR